VVSFTNKGKKEEPSSEILSPDEIKKARRVDITSYAQDSAFEPWNEFVLEGTPPTILRQRTILAKLELLVSHRNYLGDPVLNVNHNTTFSASFASSGEAGLE